MRERISSGLTKALAGATLVAGGILGGQSARADSVGLSGSGISFNQSYQIGNFDTSTPGNELKINYTFTNNSPSFAKELTGFSPSAGTNEGVYGTAASNAMWYNSGILSDKTNFETYAPLGQGQSITLSLLSHNTNLLAGTGELSTMGSGNISLQEIYVPSSQGFSVTPLPPAGEEGLAMLGVAGIGGIMRKKLKDWKKTA